MPVRLAIMKEELPADSEGALVASSSGTISKGTESTN